MIPCRILTDKAACLYCGSEGVNKNSLRTTCKKYNLPISGNKKDLALKLCLFSQNRELWEHLHRRPTLRAHRAERAEAKKTGPVKKSVLHRGVLFEGVPMEGITVPQTSECASTVEPLPSSSMSAPAQRRDQKEHESDLAWASRILKKHPYRPEHERTAMVASRRKLLIEMPAAVELKNSLVATHEALQELLARNPSAMHPSNVSIPAALPGLPPCFPDSAHAVVFPGSTESDATTLPEPLALKSRTIIMANNFKLTFTENDVPKPPAVSYAQNFDYVNEIWDDDPITGFWQGRSDLYIKGYPIAMVYWKKIYTSKLRDSWMPHQWQSLKSKLFNCAVLVQELRKFDDRQEFWNKHKNPDGTRKSYTKILLQLSKERAAQNALFVQAARDEFGADFDSVFGYRGSQGWVPKTRIPDIAKQYCIMKGHKRIEDEDEDDEEAN
ncbi:hypothetical protein BJ912DRAFT_1087128 [Pholiota molesta]|nr:hypothetical protein BJ912DRAFT_1087128 [Pholiota molesta]